MTTFFKNTKKTHFGGIAQIWAKTNFPGKKDCQFLNIPIIYHPVKNQTKLTSHSRKRCHTDGQIGRGADRQTHTQTDAQVYFPILPRYTTNKQIITTDFIINAYTLILLMKEGGM